MALRKYKPDLAEAKWMTALGFELVQANWTTQGYMWRNEKLGITEAVGKEQRDAKLIVFSIVRKELLQAQARQQEALREALENALGVDFAGTGQPQ